MELITDLQTRAQPLFEQIGWNTLREAQEVGVPLSTLLEQRDPSDEYKDGTDAFQRQLACAGIRTVSATDGSFHADRFEAFGKTEATQVLMTEWMVRQYKKVAQQKKDERAAQEKLIRSILGSDQSLVGSLMRPYVNAAGARMKQMEAAIPVNELVAVSTQITGTTYRALYLNDDVQEYRMVRVGETAEIPLSTLSQGESSITIYKVGRGLGISYELAREAPIDLVGFWIARLAVQSEVDKASIILHTIINGDGNSGTEAEVIDAFDLDNNAGGGDLTVQAWEAFQLEWDNPYSMTTILLPADILLKLRLLDTGNNNTLAGDLAGYRQLVPINPSVDGPIRYGRFNEVPAGKIVGFDNRFAIEQVTQIGATINESKKWVEKQVDAIYFSEIEGYGVIDRDAAKILDLTPSS